MSKDNADLNALPLYQGMQCSKCGRSYPKTVLNIEGFIHHGTPLQCVDTKSCQRASRKAEK